jgi:hypothetical protein
MHGPALPVAILVSLHLIKARVLAQDRIHLHIVSPEGCGFNASIEGGVQWRATPCMAWIPTINTRKANLRKEDRRSPQYAPMRRSPEDGRRKIGPLE